MDGFEECPALQTMVTMSPSPRAAIHHGNSLGKFPARNGRESQPETVIPARQPLVHEDGRSTLVIIGPSTRRDGAVKKLPRYQSNAIIYSTGVTTDASLETPPLRVDDPAWWWAEASNLRGLSGPVVRFNLAHVPFLF